MRIVGRKLQVANKLYKTDKQIAEELGIKVPTVKASVREILIITNSETRTEALLKLIHEGICNLEDMVKCL